MLNPAFVSGILFQLVLNGLMRIAAMAFRIGFCYSAALRRIRHEGCRVRN
jgi:hypothetical protein